MRIGHTIKKAIAARRAGSLPFLPSVMIFQCQLCVETSTTSCKLTFSAILAVSLALGKVVLMLSWCNKAETRFLLDQRSPSVEHVQDSVSCRTHLSSAHRCDGVLCSFLNFMPCFILPIHLYIHQVAVKR